MKPTKTRKTNQDELTSFFENILQPLAKQQAKNYGLFMYGTTEKTNSPAVKGKGCN